MAGPTDDQNPVLEIHGKVINQENNKAKDKGGVLLRGEDSNPNQGEREMSSIHRSGSRPQLDLSKAAIQGNFEERDPTILLPNQSDDISHLALDIGGAIFFFFFKDSYIWFWFSLCFYDFKLSLALSGFVYFISHHAFFFPFICVGQLSHITEQFIKCLICCFYDFNVF